MWRGDAFSREREGSVIADCYISIAFARSGKRVS
jgi:hypothetical protein